MQLCALELLNQVGIKPVRMEQHLERIDRCQIISVMTKNAGIWILMALLELP
jgi:hypothetical protein